MSIEGLTQKLIVDGEIQLFEIDLTNYGGEIFYVHGHASFYDQIENAANLKSDIIFQGKTYQAMPIAISGLDTRTDGKASRPRLVVGNVLNGIQGGMTALALRFREFAGSKIRVITTFVKYLDAANFTGGNPTASNDCFIQDWRFEQMVAETDIALDFELSNPLNHSGAILPARDISPVCAWASTGKYRGEECGYTGTAYFDNKDQPVSDPALDTCAGWTSSCKCRFGENGILRHGGFASAGFV